MKKRPGLAHLKKTLLRAYDFYVRFHFSINILTEKYSASQHLMLAPMKATCEVSIEVRPIYT